jgi:sulfur relay (sulfurtransferase) DsrC/TusE family protein
MSVELAAQSASEVTSQGEATSTTQAPQQPLASKYMAELARKEREWRAKEESLKSREQEWHQKEKLYQEQYVSKEMLKSNPLAVLQEAGLSHEELLNMAVNPPDATQMKVQQLEKQIEQLLASQQERDKKATEQTTQAYQQALKQIENEAKDLVNKSDEFELIKTYGDEGTKAIVKYIEDYFKETKTQMPVAQAAKIIEDYFFEESKKLVSVGKIKSLLGEATPQDPIEKQQVAPQSGGPKTLTHQGTTTATKPLSARDRAILAFKGQLNKG